MLKHKKRSSCYVISWNKTFKRQAQHEKEIAEKNAREEANKLVLKVQAERDEATTKLKKVEEREAEVIRKAKEEFEKQKRAAENKAHEEARQLVAKAHAERDEAATKLKKAEEREATTLKRVQVEADNLRQQELLRLRQALEADAKLALLKQQSSFAREKEGFQRHIQVMERKLQKKTSNELGDVAEVDLLESLRGVPG